MTSAGNVPSTPIDWPINHSDTGINTTIRMMKGTERSRFTTIASAP